MSFQMICRYVSKKTNGSGYRHCKSFLTYANMWRPYRSNANQAHLKRALIWPPCHKHTRQRCFALVSPTQGQTLFQCSSCDNYTTNAMNCCNCFFPRVHHGEIHINWNVFNFNRKLQYLATILEHLHTPVCGHDCIEVGKCHEGIHFTNGSFAWTLSLVHVLFQNIGKSERQQQQNKKNNRMLYTIDDNQCTTQNWKNQQS